MTNLHQQLLHETRDGQFDGGAYSPLDFERYRAALRAVVERHAPVAFRRHPLDRPECEACSTDDGLHDVPWPCSTIQAIARELGIETGDGRG